MFSRVREISDGLGIRLRVRVEAHPARALVTLERPDLRGSPHILLDGFGAEVLGGYIMAARLSAPGELPDEVIDGAFSARVAIKREPIVTLSITQLDRPPFEIPATFWDRLYAELCLVNAHVRELGRRVDGGELSH